MPDLRQNVTCQDWTQTAESNLPRKAYRARGRQKTPPRDSKELYRSALLSTVIVLRPILVGLSHKQKSLELRSFTESVADRHKLWRRACSVLSCPWAPRGRLPPLSARSPRRARSQPLGVCFSDVFAQAAPSSHRRLPAVQVQLPPGAAGCPRPVPRCLLPPAEPAQCAAEAGAGAVGAGGTGSHRLSGVWAGGGDLKAPERLAGKDSTAGEFGQSTFPMKELLRCKYWTVWRPFLALKLVLAVLSQAAFACLCDV